MGTEFDFSILDEDEAEDEFYDAELTAEQMEKVLHLQGRYDAIEKIKDPAQRLAAAKELTREIDG